MMDAAEIAKWRDKCAREPGTVFLAKGVLSLLDTLEQARKERDEAREAVAFQNKVVVAGTLKLNEARAQLDQARKDLASAEFVCDSYATENQCFFDERERAQKDAKDARALAYEEFAKVVDGLADVNRRNGDLFSAGELDEAASTIRARIEAMLEQKP